MVLVALTAACQTTVEVTLAVSDDGTGEITVAVGLDDDAAAEVGDLTESVLVADLVEAGWTVVGPSVEGDRTWLRATRAFGSPEQAEALLAGVFGAEVMRSVDLRRADGFTDTTWRFDASLDLRGGLASFSDAALAEALDGEPVGESEDAIAERFGSPVDELLALELRVELPGEVVSSTAPDGVWRMAPGDGPVPVSLVAERSDAAPLVWAVAGVVASAVALALVARLAVRWRRGRGDDTDARVDAPAST